MVSERALASGVELGGLYVMCDGLAMCGISLPRSFFFLTPLSQGRLQTVRLPRENTDSWSSIPRRPRPAATRASVARIIATPMLNGMCVSLLAWRPGKASFRCDRRPFNHVQPFVAVAAG